MADSVVDTGDLSELWIKVGAGALTKVAEAIEIPDLPSGTRGTFETTHLGTTGGFKTFRKLRRKEGDESTITGNAVLGSDDDTLLRAAEASRDAVAYKIVLYENDDVFECTGTMHVLTYKVSNPPEDRRTFELAVKWQSDGVPEAAA